MQPERKQGTDLAPVTNLSSGILSVIARAAADPNTDVDKLERLLAMQERVLARDAEQAYADAMKAAQEEIRPVAKNKINPDTKSKYTNLDALAEAIDPIIHRHGFSLSFGTADCPIPGHYRVTCKTRHTGGHTEYDFADVPIDNTGPKGSQNKTMTHGFGSALSYGRRYLKLLIFDVVTKDDDGRGAGNGATIDDAQYATLVTLIENVGADTKRFLKYMGVEKLMELPAFKYDAAVAALQSKRENGK